MSIKQKLELARLELLDMGLRANPLLHVSGRGAKYLEVVEERSADVFGILVECQHSMRFLPIPEIYEEENEDDESEESEPLPSLEDYLDDSVGEGRFSDRYLQTRLSAEKLDTRLLKIENEAHTLLQEQGIDVLYLALGFLEWYEDNNAHTPRFAPLVLVPVELGRESARRGFSISYTGGDLGPNLTLAAKLRGDFRVQLPEFEEEFDIQTYFQHVQSAIANEARWQVHPNQIGLGFFSFGKFQMYVDLNPENWPDSAEILENAQLEKLFDKGFLPDAELLESVSEHDYLKTPEALHLVKDADSSQLEAILAVMEGANLVIQGPPGTGKSQTITNLIGEAVARGKKVLFVAQKMAALDVVKKRLDECHLGNAVLELHSHKSQKKAVLASLKQVFDQGRPETPDRSSDYQRLTEVREHLDSYVEVLRWPILQSGLNYIDCLGQTLSLKEDDRLSPLARIPFQLLEAWGPDHLSRGQRALEAIEDYLVEYGAPADNPFSASRRTSLSPTEEQELRKQVGVAAVQLAELLDEAQKLANAMSLPEPEQFSDIAVLYRAGQRALDAPHLAGIRLNTQDWQARRDEIHEVLECGSKMTEIRTRLAERFIEAAYDADMLSVRVGLAGYADKWWRIFSGTYRRAKTGLRGFIQGKLSGKPLQWLAWVDDLMAYQKTRQRFNALEPTAKSLFGAQWQGERSDWGVLERLSRWVIDLYDEIGKGELPAGITDFLEADPDLKGWSEPLKLLDQRATQVKGILRELVSFIDWADLDDIEELSLTHWVQQLEAWKATETLYAAVRFNQLQGDIQSAGLGSLVAELRQWRHSPRALTNWLRWSYFSGLVDYAYATNPLIGQFDRLSHERLIQEFVGLDGSTFSFAQESLVKKIHEALPAFNAPGEMDVLRREFSKKRRHIPIRRLVSEAGTVIQQGKPIFMMSPMSVATYLPQGKIHFDLVIFDEASQIPAPEALGAILRGNQTVVVGDSKQMPPTNFFSKTIEMTDDEADESATADVESILGLMLAKGVPERMLRWHYRSRHHSLIAVSNDQFYQNKLLIFPSPGTNTFASGLELRYLPDAHYDRGGSRTNLGEAQAVALAVMHHAQSKPSLSLGVVAFSTAQRDAIVLEVERLRREHPDVEEFFKHHQGSDEFFIKNLENVQGDERDIIFISIGYGRTEAGNLGQNFGPLNGKGGERRLNVLMSRARLAMKVFSNFKAEDMRTDANSPFGVRALKVFLHYAETGELPHSAESQREPDSPFELQVKRAIENLGYEVQPQVGSEGFFIDLAVRDPDKPGRYLLAVECDGASYHSSAIARDRDRLRQSILEGLGWRFHRIWSTEWFRNPSAEIGRVREAIESAARYVSVENEQPAQTTEARTPSEVQIARRKPESREPLQLPPYEPVSEDQLGLPPVVQNFLDIPDGQLKTAIMTVVDAEGPVHSSVLTSRLIGAVGLSRAGSRIQSQVWYVAEQLEKEGELELDDEFLARPTTEKPAPLRDWSTLPVSQRKFEFIPDDELAHAIFLTVRDGYSVGVEDCMSAAIGLLGFKRLTESIRERLESIVQRLLEMELISANSGRLQLTDGAREHLFLGLR